MSIVLLEHKWSSPTLELQSQLILTFYTSIKSILQIESRFYVRFSQNTTVYIHFHKKQLKFRNFYGKTVYFLEWTVPGTDEANLEN